MLHAPSGRCGDPSCLCMCLSATSVRIIPRRVKQCSKPEEKSMSESSVSNKRVLTGLPASAFQHPWDKAATSKLESMSVLNKLVAKFNEHSIERVAYVQNLGSNLRVGPRQASKLYQMLRECCEILDVKEPELYIQQGEVNAYTAGHNRPYIVLETGLLEVMNDDEVMG